MTMAKDFDRILDECIDRMNRGERMEACLAEYPEHARQLEPLLRAVTQTKAVYSFSPTAEAKRAARQRFYAALDRQRQSSLWQKVFSRRLAWATLSSVLVVLLVGYFALRATVFVEQIPTITIPNPSAEGNFVFLVSDDVNAITDFSSLKVSIDKVALLHSGDSESWVEFVPEAKEFDLTLLTGDRTQELWRGNVPEGEYTKVVIYVSQVHGILKATGETVDVKLPSDKLQISKSFQVSTGNVTSFTYDLTVIKTGNAQNGKYILKPQAGESGTGQQADSNRDKGKEKQNKQP